MGLLIRLVINAVALYVVTILIPGVTASSYTSLAIAAIALGIVNAVLRPLLVIVSLPFEIVTLGLFTFVINALLFLLVGHLGIGFRVHGFGAALLGSIVVSIVSYVLSLVFAPERRPAGEKRR